MMIIFNFYKFFVVMDGISANDLFQASAFSKGYNGKCAFQASAFSKGYNGKCAKGFFQL